VYIVLESSCPNCRGALYIESFKLDGKKYIEITCLNCARIWTPRTISQIVSFNRNIYGDEWANLVKRELQEAVIREVGERYVV